MFTEPAPQGRDDSGKFTEGPDPLVPLGVRVRRSRRELLQALARGLGVQPTPLARELLEAAIEEAATEALLRGQGGDGGSNGSEGREKDRLKG